MNMGRKNLILALLAIALAVGPLVFLKDAEFAGADAQAEEMITTVAADYEPWFKSVYEPPSGEIESLLFALQAAIGSGVVFYYIGYKKGQKSGAEAKSSSHKKSHRPSAEVG